jgi:hypothetical protein
MKRTAIEGGLLFGVALLLRAGGAWMLGEGAPFGPDGTGAEASVHLPGHLYPLHIFLISVVGDGRALSVVCGALTCLLLWIYGRRLGLGSAGGWLAAALPLAVYPSCLTAGDAPALLFVVAGATFATFGRGAAVAGGALAMASIAVKPVVLPALVLLLPTPLAFFGAMVAMPAALPWLKPLLDPNVGGGLLGSWWLGNNGSPPASLDDALHLVQGGARALVEAPLWTMVPLTVLAGVGAAWPWSARREEATPTRWARGAVIGPILGVMLLAALFGERLAPRYLAASMLALLPWVGALVPRPTAALLLVPTFAVLSQVASYRAQADPTALVPAVPVLPIPPVGAGALFDEASTEGATALRAEAHQLAQSLPQGATVTVERRAHGREGELVWPLRVLRPDVKIEVIAP